MDNIGCLYMSSVLSNTVQGPLSDGDNSAETFEASVQANSFSRSSNDLPSFTTKNCLDCGSLWYTHSSVSNITTRSFCLDTDAMFAVTSSDRCTEFHFRTFGKETRASGNTIAFERQLRPM